MQFLTNLVQQMQTLWAQTGQAARVGIAVTAVLCVAAVVGVGIWASSPNYVPIASELSPTAAREIVSKLEAAQIPSQMNYSGSVVLVPQNLVNKASLALGDLTSSAPPSVDSLQDSLISDPALKHFRILRNREAELANTIRRIAGVENATVHISQPEPSPFLRDSRPATASVVLTLRRGVIFTREQARSIVSIVAGGVEGLRPDQVTVTDTSGRQLTSDATSADAEIASQYEYQRNLEADLASKAELMLAQMLGPGRAVVRVTADLDFTRQTRESIKYDPEMKVKKKEKSTTSSSTILKSPPSAGASSNLDPAPSVTPPSKPQSEKTEETDTEYETPMTTDKITEAVGKIKRLTVAATVDLPGLEGTAGAAGATGSAGAGGTGSPAAASAAVTREQIESLLKQAVGFDQRRNDEIVVVVSKLAGLTAADPLAGTGAPVWEQYRELIRVASLGVGSLVALLLGLLILRRLRPVSLAASPLAVVKAARSQQIADLQAKIVTNPEIVSRIIEAWLKQTGKDEAETPPDAARAKGTKRAA